MPYIIATRSAHLRPVSTNRAIFELCRFISVEDRTACVSRRIEQSLSFAGRTGRQQHQGAVRVSTNRAIFELCRQGNRLGRRASNRCLDESSNL